MNPKTNPQKSSYRNSLWGNGWEDRLYKALSDDETLYDRLYIESNRVHCVKSRGPQGFYITNTLRRKHKVLKLIKPEILTAALEDDVLSYFPLKSKLSLSNWYEYVIKAIHHTVCCLLKPFETQTGIAELHESKIPFSIHTPEERRISYHLWQSGYLSIFDIIKAELHTNPVKK